MLNAQQERVFILHASIGLLEARRIVSNILSKPLEVQDKGTQMRDLVTQADDRVERDLQKSFLAKFPDFAFFGEETHKKGERINPDIPTIVVDPLDGTTNFVAGIPMVAVSVGLWYQRQARAAAILSLADGAVYTAMRSEEGVQVTSGGALFARPCKIIPRVGLSQALIGFDWPHKDDRRQSIRPAIDTFLNEGRNVRVLGSAVLALLAVAQGALDAYVNAELFPWDVAAAALIIEKAGGMVTDFEGNPWTPDSPRLVASYPGMHEEILRALKR